MLDRTEGRERVEEERGNRQRSSSILDDLELSQWVIENTTIGMISISKSSGYHCGRGRWERTSIMIYLLPGCLKAWLAAVLVAG